MHKKMLDEIIARCRQRLEEGDCPTVNSFNVELLEGAIIELARRPQAASVAVVPLNDLLSAKDLAIASLGKLQNEFEKLNIYTYAEMMEGLAMTINGAVIIAKQTKNL